MPHTRQPDRRPTHRNLHAVTPHPSKNISGASNLINEGPQDPKTSRTHSRGTRHSRAREAWERPAETVMMLCCSCDNRLISGHLAGNFQGARHDAVHGD